MKRIIFTIVGALFFVSSSSWADDTSELTNFFKSLQSFSAEFEQTVEKSQMAMAERSKGYLVIQKPGKFRWDYVLPYEQEIVSNGKKVWIYDVDLEQVTIKPVDQALGNTPAMLLSSQDALEKTFDISAAETIEGTKWFSLKPKDSEAGFTEILIGFDKNQMSEMMLVDNLGQITRLVFFKFNTKPVIKASVFEFIPPKGADVFDTTR